MATSQWLDRPASRHSLALGLAILPVVLFFNTAVGLVRLAATDERSSHILVVPLISAFFLWHHRERIFSVASYRLAMGIPIVLLTVTLGLLLQTTPWAAAEPLPLGTATIFVAWMGGFLACYGSASFRAASFPLLLLILMVPIPAFLIDRLVLGLQHASADVSHALFRLVGMPFTRQGLRFSLPGVDVEIAEQCSSIRSSISLFIAGLVASHVLLDKPWKKVCLCLLTIPIAIFKNGIRIVTLSWLGVYWNQDFFYGKLHRYGGLPFSLIALALLVLSLVLLKGRVPALARPRS